MDVGMRVAILPLADSEVIRDLVLGFAVSLSMSRPAKLPTSHHSRVSRPSVGFRGLVTGFAV